MGRQLTRSSGWALRIAAQMGPVGGKGSCEQALGRRLFRRLEEDWLLIANRGFYHWPDWQAAAAVPLIDPVDGTRNAPCHRGNPKG